MEFSRTMGHYNMDRAFVITCNVSHIYWIIVIDRFISREQNRKIRWIC